MASRQELQLKNEWWMHPHYKIEEADWPKRDLFTVVKDNLKHPLILNIVGLRRVGKSTILKQIIAHLFKQKINRLNVFYFLFDYASQIQKAEFLDEVLSLYFSEVLKKTGSSLKERVYILLDEIQYIKDWQGILKKYYDLSNKRIKFIISGSQSLLLRGKYRESLAGRIFDYYLPPLSFAEFLRINKEKVKIQEQFDLFNLPAKFGELSKYDVYYGKQIASLSQEYIISGQFPETRQFTNSPQRQEYITESVLGKVLEDCLRLFKIEKADEFKLFAYQLLNNISSIFELKNMGQEIGISKLTLDKYLEYLKDSYVVEVLYKHHRSLIKRGRILKKIYTPCVNFNCALNHYQESHIAEVPQAFGKIIENVIYNVLSDRYKEHGGIVNNLSFWRQGEKEIDFIIAQDKKYLPIEVKFSAAIGSKDLAVLIDYLKRKEVLYGVVATKETLDKKEVQGQILYFIPYYLLL